MNEHASELVEVPAHVQEAFDDAAAIMSAAFPSDDDAVTGRDAEIGESRDAEIAPAPIVEREGDRAASLANVVELTLRDITRDPEQPRLEVDSDLAESIRANGVLQPIVVRPHPKAGDQIVGINMAHPPYMLVDGERRWLGAMGAGLETIPARIALDVVDVGDRLLHQVLFNDGKRLTALEEAKAWRRILTEKHWNIQKLAKALGRPKSTVSDRLAMLDAPPQFQPLFIDGTLSAAAAPIIRSIAHLRADLIDQIAERIQQDYTWQQHVTQNQTVPLAVVERGIGNCLTGYPFAEIFADFADYQGETFEVKGKRYAVKAHEYRQYVQDQRVARAGGEKVQRADAYVDRQAEEHRKRRQARDRKVQLRRAQFDAVSKKLPTSLDAAAALFVITSFVREMQQLTQIAACKGLGIEMPKKTLYGADHRKLLVAHAEQLDAKARVRMLLQLAMAGDLQVSEYDSSSAEQIAAAAKLVRLDLKRVTVPDPAKKSAKKPGTALVPTQRAAKRKPATKGRR